VRPKLTMPDLLPPTVREPEQIATGGGKGRTFVAIAALLVVIGGVIGAVLWGVYLKPDRPKAKREKPAATAGRSGVDAPPTPIDVPPAPPPPENAGQPGAPTPTAAPSSAPVPEKLSPCQTAIFSAVQGRCDVAKRAYARCNEDSPYFASAQRAIGGLCP